MKKGGRSQSASSDRNRCGTLRTGRRARAARPRSPRGTPRREATKRARREGEELDEMGVRDDGEGIEALRLRASFFDGDLLAGQDRADALLPDGLEECGDGVRGPEVDLGINLGRKDVSETKAGKG